MILDLISVEETDCLRRPCVQSCCEYDEVFNHQTGRCDEPVSVTVWPGWTEICYLSDWEREWERERDCNLVIL